MSNVSEDIDWKEVIKLWVSKVALEQREIVIDPLSDFKGWRRHQGRIKKDLQRG